MMHVAIRILGLLAVILLPLSAAQNEFLEALPGCAYDCLITTGYSSSCNLTDQACLCVSSPLRDRMNLCVSTTCSIPDSFSTQNATDAACGVPLRNKSQQFVVISTALGSTSIVFVAIRFGFKTFITKTSIELDDWFILLTAIVGIPATVINSQGLASNGLGQDIWTQQPNTITAFLGFYLVWEILYYTEISLLKLSILLFYLRIFPGTGVRRLMWGTAAVTVLYGLVFAIVAIFQCQPVSYFWTNWDGLHPGACLDMQAIAWMNAGIGISIDIWMLALPLHQIRHLNLHWKKKIGVALMFCVGTFVTIFSILRLQTLLEFASSTNATMDHLDIATWSSIEVNVGIICACMPTMRLILVRLFPIVMGSTIQRYGSDRGSSQGTVRSRPGAGIDGEVTGSVILTKSETIKNGSFLELDREDEEHQ